MNMSELAKTSQAGMQEREIEKKHRYFLERATAIENRECPVEQRFGIVLDANYYKGKASELKDVLNEVIAA
jgi:hypothetical protein